MAAIGGCSYKTYEHGGDWQKELIEELAGFGGGALAVKIVISTFEGPPGWVVIIGAVGANMLADYTGKTLAKLIMNLE